MAKSQDYVALEWVSGEIAETLKQAKQALEAYVQNPQDSSQLRFCLTYIHQVYGTLKMVEFNGATLFAEELEALAQALVDGSLPNEREGLIALMGGLLQLPPYLQRLKVSHRDAPSALLPTINDMRAARAASALEEFAFFTPDLSRLKLSSDAPVQLSKAEFVGLVEKLRQMFQIAFVGIVRDKKLGKNLQYLAKVCQRLRLMSLGKQHEAMWSVALALIEGIANRSIPPTSGVKSLLKQIDTELKGLVERGPSYMDGEINNELMRQFLYHIAKSKNDSPLMADLRQAYQLEAALPKSYEEFVAPPDYEAVAAVIDALLEELAAVKDFLDLYVRNDNQQLDVLRPAQPMLKRVADTMSLLGFNEPLQTIRDQLSILTDYIAGEGGDLQALQEMASYVISVEHSLTQYLSTNGDSVHKTEAQLHFDSATEVVVREVCSLLEQVKESIVEFVADQLNPEHLQPVPAMLSAASGALMLSSLERIAAAVKACEHYTSACLMNKSQAQWQQLDKQPLDTLADAISSIDYYLERLLEDFDGVDNSAIIVRAEESLVSLGYEFDGECIVVPEAVLESSAEPRDKRVDEQATFEAVKPEAVKLAPEAAVSVEIPENETVAEDDEDAIDPEILEIFVEEAEEVLASINQWLPAWLEGDGKAEGLSEVRRAFHTLKGSGRMVGATTIGELAWSIENMLNRVMDKSLELDSTRVAWIALVTQCFPAMVEAFEAGKTVNESYVSELTAVSDCLAKADGEVDVTAYDSHRVIADTDVVVEEEAVSELIVDDEAGINSPSETLQIDEEAAMLLEVFEQEARTHLETIYNYITEALESVDPRYITDSLQRALHTLKGSAHMADVTSIARIVGPAEKLVKGMQASRVRAPGSVLSVLQTTTNLVEQGLQLLPEHAHVELEGSAELLFDIEELTDHILTDPHLSGVNDDAIDPELLSQLLTEGMDKLSAVEDILDAETVSVSGVTTISTLLTEFNLIVDSIPIQPMHELVTAVIQACAAVREDNVTCFTPCASQAVDTVIGMMDCIAASMDIAPADELVAEIGRWCDEQTVEDELVLSAMEASAVPEIVLEVPGELNFEQPLMTADDELSASSAAELEPLAVEGLLEEESPLEEIQQQSAIEGSLSEPTEAEELSFAEVVIEQTVEPELELTSLAAEQTPLEDAFFEEQLLAEGVDDEVSTETPEIEPVIAPQDEGLLVEPVSQEPLQSAAETMMLTEPAEQVADTHSLFADDDDELDDEIIEIFIEEAADLLEGIDETLQSWAQDIDDSAAMPELLRLLHTFKGGARLAAADALGDLSHDFETYVIGVDASNKLDQAALAEFQQFQDRLHHSMDRFLTSRRSGADVVEAAVSEAAAPAAVLEESVTDNGVLIESFSGTDSIDEVVERTDELVIAAPEQLTVESTVEADLTTGLSEQQVVATREDLLELNADHDRTEPVKAEASMFKAPSVKMVAIPKRSNELAATDGLNQLSQADALNQAKTPQEVIKVSAQLLEELVNLAGETTIARGRVEEQVSDISYAIEDMESTIDRLQDQLRRLDTETEAQILFRQEQMESSGVEEFDPLEMDRYTALQQLSRSLIESASDIADIKGTISDKARDIETLLLQQSRVNTDLQEGLMRSRMVPFSRMVPRLRRIVRQVGSELDKKVNFVLDNTEGEMDRIVLERMVAPLEHMLRNAIDHGIEPVQQRLQAGKPEQGNIVISMAREGGEVVINLEDDGAGIDLQAVRQKAVDNGLMTSDAELTDHEVMQFVLHAGFSTAQEVTQISGRGVGLDVVHSEIKLLGGMVDISSNHGLGTRFTVRLPFTVSVNRALMVKVAGDIYAIPLNTIEGVVRVSPFELEAYYQPEAPLFEYAGQPYNLRYMGSLLQSQAKPKLSNQSAPLPVVLVRGADHAVAVQVDALLGSREIVVKNLGPQFSRVQGLTGATVLGDGSVVVILDLMAMIRADISQGYSQLEQGDGQVEKQDTLTVMVVDDSVTVRKVTSRFLERNGMNVLLAKDGADAMQLLIDHKPDVMLLDIEMPRMDGFEVASRVKHSDRLRDIPIIMITSRTGDKHRERAFSLGVDRYLGKPYQEAQLLETLAELVVLPE
ncbi:chemosensory pili system protein ChpA (sensor histidine kinase/response regulator) [Sinobacterium caligoides]|uniref:Chemotaxis protein CheA n=1 Tax=Sinobacterium caligoides TaxID=933926 RepID=A0A3N2DGZ0_9GAMM|nr:Hpt domain-containing protein [Sinobacterium caligoides]ROR98918.1 chemosensory pili system protein ChpA (sensor histidine kinase/response regulator) [Sinobacterium caligoides]